MVRPHPRSQHRLDLRFHDRAEGHRPPARAGLRLRRHVLRRPDLDARELSSLRLFVPRQGARDPGPFAFARDVSCGVRHLTEPLARVTALTSRGSVPVPRSPHGQPKGRVMNGFRKGLFATIVAIAVPLHAGGCRELHLRRRMECPHLVIERDLRQRRDRLDRHQQRSDRFEQRCGDGVRPRRRCRQHQRHPEHRHQARRRLRPAQRHLRLRHLARRPVLGHVDRGTNVICVSRTRCSAQRCCAEPGPSSSGKLWAPDRQRIASRCVLSGAREASRAPRRIPRPSPAPARSSTRRRALPAWRCGTCCWSARRRASAFHPAESRRCRRDGSP